MIDTLRLLRSRLISISGFRGAFLSIITKIYSKLPFSTVLKLQILLLLIFNDLSFLDPKGAASPREKF